MTIVAISARHHPVGLAVSAPMNTEGAPIDREAPLAVAAPAVLASASHVGVEEDPLALGASTENLPMLRAKHPDRLMIPGAGLLLVAVVANLAAVGMSLHGRNYT